MRPTGELRLFIPVNCVTLTVTTSVTIMWGRPYHEFLIEIVPARQETCYQCLSFSKNITTDKIEMLALKYLSKLVPFLTSWCALQVSLKLFTIVNCVTLPITTSVTIMWGRPYLEESVIEHVPVTCKTRNVLSVLEFFKEHYDRQYRNVSVEIFE